MRRGALVVEWVAIFTDNRLVCGLSLRLVEVAGGSHRVTESAARQVYGYGRNLPAFIIHCFNCPEAFI